MIIDIFEGVTLRFLIFAQLLKKNRNSHVLVFHFGVYLGITRKLSILFVVDKNLGIVLKNRIIDIFEGVRLQFLHIH